jgi:hypothetical protein
LEQLPGSLAAMFVKGLLILCSVTFVAADLRMASQPRIGYQLRNQGTTPWKVLPWKYHMHYRYYEPSAFGYAGLQKQKRRNYDNFLRSNIDNEQDNRDFNTEDGKDHLPFRSYETAVYPNRWRPAFYNRRFRTVQPPSPIVLTKEMYPGQSMLVPFRWNNPHVSEMEVNIWIFQHATKDPIVIPIRKPSCSGEGHQDNIISFTVPKDFNTLGSKIPGFKGCNAWTKPMCTLQIYSHSVESRMYAIGFPIVIPGFNSSLTTADSSGIQAQSKDPWLDLSSLRDLCLPATDPSATITTSVPRWARLVSDVYTHAYMNSDYSPYSGQQFECISKNLQASAINKMETGNRGELGKSILPAKTSSRLKYLRKLEERIYKNYETLGNKIINAIGHKMKTGGAFGVQKLAHCFRCGEVGSVTTTRLNTNTYIPSWQLPKDLVADARAVIPAKYASMITASGQVHVYLTALKDLLPFFYMSRNLGVIYQEAELKTTLTTKAHPTAHKKRNPKGTNDGGVYASWMAKQEFAKERGCPSYCLFPKLAAPAGSWYCVANYQKRSVSGPFPDLKGAQAKMAANRGNFQVPCKMTAAGAANGGPSYRRYRRYVNQLVGMCNSNVPCRINVGQDDFHKPLVRGAPGTNTSAGACAACVQFFGKKVHPLKKPTMTKLSKELVKKGGNFLPQNIANLGSNPDDRPSTEGSLLQQKQKSRTDKEKRAMINKRHLNRVQRHMEYAELHQDDESIFSALDDVTPLAVDHD